ncbi:MAG: hypothetical protein FJY76_04280 [Candidatus Aenigmarchaeota archaeon]|nr:hypothetical protein [Candidatus Aenigmarchaeota archaeon]
MPIVGLSFNSIEARRKQLPRGEIKVNSSPKVSDIKEVDMPSLGKKALSLTFEFLTEYQPDIGSIRVEGEMVYMADSNAKILAQWKKDRTLPEDASVEILNQLFRKCLLKVSNFAEELQLPIPIQIPRVMAKAKEKEKEPKEAKEKAK